MHIISSTVSRTFVVVICLTVLLASAPFALAANPSAPFTPSQNVQDPGAASAPGTGGTGCGPTDSNCYVDLSGTFSSISTSGNATVGTGASTVNTFGTGAGATNTFGNATGTNTVNGTTTFNGNTTISANNSFTQNGTGTFSTGTGAVSLNGNTTAAGDLTVQGNTTLGNGAGDITTITGILNLLAAKISGTLALVFEGATVDGVTTSISVTDPTANRTITLPDASGTVLLSGQASSVSSLTDTGALQVDGNTTLGNATTDTTTITGGTTITTAAAGLLNLLGGNLQVGNGTPDVALNGEDAYVEGTLEVDGATRLDGALSANAGIAVSGGNLTVAANNNITQSGTGTFTTGTGAVSLNGDTTIAAGKNLSVGGNTTLGDASSDRLTVTAQLLGSSALSFQGSTDDAFTTTFSITDPTANRTITFKDGTGTVAFISDITNTKLTDNITDAYDLEEGTNNYLNINTTNSSENISFGNATTNPTFSYLGSGAFSVAGNASFAGTVAVTGAQTLTGNTDLRGILSDSTGNLTITDDTDLTGNLTLVGNQTTTGSQTIQTSTATDDQLSLTVTTGGASRFLGSLTLADLTAARTWTLPDSSGTFALLGGTGSFSSIVNSGTLDQQGNISSSTGDVTVADNLAITANNNFTQSGTGTFSTGTGAISLNGATSVTGTNTLTTGTGQVTFGGNVDANAGLDVSGGNLTVAANNNITQSGTGTFSTGTGTVSLNGAVTAGSTLAVTGNQTNTANLTVNGNTTLGDAITDNLIFTGALQGANALIFDGATDDTNETTFTFVDPTADNTITFKNASGTVAFLSDIFATSLTDNTVDAYDLQEGTNNYLNINTTNAAENISFGNATTNPTFSYLGSGAFSVAGNASFAGTLAVTGNQTNTGDIALNGGDLTTTSTTATIVDTNATTVNIAGAGTAVSLGAATGTTTINNASTAITGNATIGGTTGLTFSGIGSDITFSSGGNNDITTTGVLRLGAFTLLGALTGNGQNATGFADVSNTGNTTLGDASADTLVVNATPTFNTNVNVNSNKITNLATPVSSGDAVNKSYVDNAFASGVLWQKPVIGLASGAAPGAPASGDRYLLQAGHSGFGACATNDIAEWNGSAWVCTSPSLGSTTFVDSGTDQPYNYNGTAWVSISGTIQHNNTTSLQGGTTNEYYHLTSANYNALNIGTNSQIRNANGTAALPSYTFDADQDTGIYRKASNTLGFSVGGTNVFDVTATGDLVPTANNTYSLGSGTNKWKDIFAVGGISGDSLTITGNTILGDAVTDTVSVNGTLTLTPASAGYLSIQDGNLRVGNGTPDVALDGEDAYVEGTFEVDGTTRFDGAVTMNSTLTTNGSLTAAAGLSTTTFATTGSVTLGDASADRLTVNAQIQGANPFVLQGATDNAFATTLSLVDPTANQSITFPDASGTVLLSGNALSVSSITNSGNTTLGDATTDTTTVNGATSIASGTNTTLTLTRTAAGQYLSFVDGTNTNGLYSVTATPEGSLTANKGSIALDGTNGVLYVKNSGVGNTGWVQVATGNTLYSGDGSITGNRVIGMSTNTLTFDGAAADVVVSNGGLSVGSTLGVTGNTTLSGTLGVNGNTTLGDAAGDTLTINGTAVSTPNGLNVDSNTLVIDATNDYVGIGDATPDFRLELEGTGSIAQRTIGINDTAVLYLPDQAGTAFTGSFAVGNGLRSSSHTAGSEGFYNTAVGISTLLSNTTGTTNTAMGYESLRFNTTSGYSTAIGAFSMRQQTAGGGFNNGLGYQTLYTNSTGQLNNAVGYRAMFSNTTGGANNAFGSETLLNNTTGINNVAVGASSLRTNTTGSSNTAVGQNSLFANDTGIENTAMGGAALGSNTTGSGNVAAGYRSLTANTTGAQNSAYGYDSLNKNIVGNLSAAFGYHALYNALAGQNTAFGANAGEQLTTGINNTFVGYTTGASITTGSANTIIGSNVTGLANGLSNNIILADGDGNRRINVDSSGNVGINTTGPDRRLDILDASNPQIRATYTDGTVYTDMQTDSTGDLLLSNTGTNVRINDGDFYVCTGGACPVTSATGNGNVLVENKVGIGSLSATPTTKLQIAGGSALVEESSLTDGATITVDWQTSNQQKITLGGNRTIAFSNIAAGQILRLMVCQDATGSRTLTWPASVQWSGGSAPTLTTTASKCDVVSFVGTNATGSLKAFGTSTLNF